MKKFIVGLALMMASSIGFCEDDQYDKDSFVCNLTSKNIATCGTILDELNIPAKIDSDLLMFGDGTQFEPKTFIVKDNIVFFSIFTVLIDLDKSKNPIKHDAFGVFVPKYSAVMVFVADCVKGTSAKKILNVIDRDRRNVVNSPMYFSRAEFLKALQNAPVAPTNKTSIGAVMIKKTCENLKKEENKNYF